MLSALPPKNFEAFIFCRLLLQADEAVPEHLRND